MCKIGRTTIALGHCPCHQNKGKHMIIKRNMAVDSLTKVCEESLALIKQLIDVDNATYAQGYEDGMAAQAKVQQTLREQNEKT